MAKMLVIGVDGMDTELIEKYSVHLPNFTRIREANRRVHLTSVFPPDSDSAWASIYTGLDPSKHGIVEFVDPVERSKIQRNAAFPDIAPIRGNTFWDIAGKLGKKVFVLFPHIAYPAWPVNGLMISSGSKDFDVRPIDFKFGFEHPKRIQSQKRIPRSKLEFSRYLKQKKTVIAEEFEFAQKMLMHHEADLFFVYSSALDSIMHIFWNYCDPADPTYPGNNPFMNVIRDFYVLYDTLIGTLLNSIPSDTSVLILSDHGHAMRPVNLFNINEILRQEGYLSGRQGGRALKDNFTERIKRAVADTAQRSGLRPLAMTILRAFPFLKRIYSRPSNIDFDKTLAHCTDLSGMKSYSYGGIIIRRNRLNSEADYRQVKSEIIEMLRSWHGPESPSGVLEWICPREDMYHGPFIGRYPDILFKLAEGFGAGWAINVPVFSKSFAHKFYPGSHRGETPVFYMLNTGNRRIVKPDVTLMDVAPTILDLLDIDWKGYGFDGRSILANS